METPQKKRKRDEKGERIEGSDNKDIQAFLVGLWTQWTPNRHLRLVDQSKKVRSADDGPFMGGDWVLNSSGGGATLSFCFEGANGEDLYGLTVGHLVASTGIGAPLFRFAESHPISVPDDEAKPDEYFMFEIGEVTSMSTETDSLVFKLDLTKDQCSPMDIAMASDSILTIDSDLLSLADRPCECGKTILGFGAQRRGALGFVTETSAPSPGMFSFAGDIGIMQQEGTSATDGGDCGAIFVSMDTGAPIYFHHVLSHGSDGGMVSFGVPLMKILGAHKETQHLIPSSAKRRPQTMSEQEPKERFKSPARKQVHEVAGLRQFNTRIVDRKFKTAAKFVGRKKEAISPSANVKKWDVTKSIQKRDLPVFNVRVLPRPSRGPRSKTQGNKIV